MMKKIWLIFILVIIVFVMAACGSSKESPQVQSDVQEQNIVQEQSSPEMAVIGYLNAFQSGRQDKANQYVTEDDVIYSADAEDNDIAMIQMLFGNITYKIKSVNIENDTAIVITDINNVDMKMVMQEIQNILKASSGMTQEAIIEMIEETIEKNKDNIVTQTIEIEVIKVNQEWKVKTTLDLLTAISGGVTPEGIAI